MTAITRFRGNYAFLSNFYSSLIEVNGIVFPTVEHAFQAAKVALTFTPEQRRELQLKAAMLPNPADAKRFGRSVPLRADWRTAHLPIMRRLLALKFAPGSKLAAALVGTGCLPLIEGNDWGDTYWGQCNGKGRNQLGVLLMEQRAVLAPIKPQRPAQPPVPPPTDAGVLPAEVIAQACASETDRTLDLY